MQLIEIIYLSASAVAVLAMIPQVFRLIKVKRSDALSISTWSMWAACQTVSLSYAISIGKKPLIITGTIWLLFYFVMVVLIFKYRTKPLKLEYTPEMVEVAEYIKSHPVLKEILEKDRR